MVCVRGENIEIALKEAGKYKSVNKIQELNIPIVIPTVDINNEKEYIFTNSDKLEGDKYIKEIEIAKAVRASSSFPVLFAPFKYEKHAFIDGGVLNNVPVGELKKIGIKKTIAVNFISCSTSITFKAIVDKLIVLLTLSFSTFEFMTLVLLLAIINTNTNKDNLTK